jgi:MOSC domain-containing protein YiiM
MENQVYRIKIKKEYASALIEDLRQADAIEILEEPTPEWQKKETIKRLADMKANPTSTMNEEAFLKAMDEEDE